MSRTLFAIGFPSMVSPWEQSSKLGGIDFEDVQDWWKKNYPEYKERYEKLREAGFGPGSAPAPAPVPAPAKPASGGAGTLLAVGAGLLAAGGLAYAIFGGK